LNAGTIAETVDSYPLAKLCRLVRVRYASLGATVGDEVAEGVHPVLADVGVVRASIILSSSMLRSRRRGIRTIVGSRCRSPKHAELPILCAYCVPPSARAYDGRGTPPPLTARRRHVAFDVPTSGLTVDPAPASHRATVAPEIAVGNRQAGARRRSRPPRASDLAGE
jgi:hypothetical protein